MFVVARLLVGTLLGDTFTLHSFGDGFNGRVLHRTNALFLQIFFNFVIVDAINCHRSPQFLEFIVDWRVGCFVVVK